VPELAFLHQTDATTGSDQTTEEATVSEQTIEYEGAAVHVTRAGDGPPLLYLHDAGGGRSWTEFHEKLASSFEVVAPDLPGFSRSDFPEWLDGIDDLVYFCLDLMEDLAFETYALVGGSLGGWIAAEIAVHHPERIRSVVLLAPLGLELRGLSYTDLFTLNPVQAAEASFSDPAKGRASVPAAGDGDALVEAYRNRTAFARLAWTSCFANPKLAGRLRRVKAPSLLVWGDDDRIVPTPYTNRWAELIPHAQLKTVGACGHAIVAEQPQAAATLVSEFCHAAV
jgi:pimeloyl-ACP methyl ester carboxylesterase